MSYEAVAPSPVRAGLALARPFPRRFRQNKGGASRTVPLGAANPRHGCARLESRASRIRRGRGHLHGAYGRTMGSLVIGVARAERGGKMEGIPHLPNMDTWIP